MNQARELTLKTLRLYHDEHFELLRPEDAPNSKSLGTYSVIGRDGEEEIREKHRRKVASNFTDSDLPDEFPGSLQELTHFLDTVADRHSDKVTAVSGSDSALTARIAAVLGVDVVEEV